jgi:hypothetical protein
MVMAYIKKTVKAGKTMEIIKYHDRAHGKKGGPRQKRKNPTSLRQELANRRRAENRLRWLLNANFKDGDLSLTCTYVRRAGEEPISPEEMKKHMKKFLSRLRVEYRKAGKELKYIHVMEVGERGARHHHLVVNYLDERIIQRVWESVYPDPRPDRKASFIRQQMLNTNGQYGKLASYLIKQTSAKLHDEDAMMKKSWTCSRNLTKPDVKTEVVGASTFRKEPTAPKGWYIEPDSIRRSTDPDGYDWMSYRMMQIGTKGGPDLERMDLSRGSDRNHVPADVGSRGGPQKRSRAKGGR